MDKQEIEISIYCFSEKEDVGIGFGSSVDTEENDFSNELDFDFSVMQESFWENYFEFESGIEKAITSLKKEKKITLKQALFEVFGHFKVIVRVDDKEYEPEDSFINEIENYIYSMLETVCD